MGEGERHHDRAFLFLLQRVIRVMLVVFEVTAHTVEIIVRRARAVTGAARTLADAEITVACAADAFRARAQRRRRTRRRDRRRRCRLYRSRPWRGLHGW